MATSSGSPCAACKFLRRKCTPECVFAPYFPPDQPQKFANVHKIFGASNITKLLNDLPHHQREDAVNSLAYEADARVKDPVYGCVGAISILQRRVAQLQAELSMARSELSRYATSSMLAGSTTAVASHQQGSGASLPLGISVGHPNTATREQVLSAREQLAEYGRVGAGHYHDHRSSTMGLGAGSMGSQIMAFPHTRPDTSGSGRAASGNPIGHFKMEP